MIIYMLYWRLLNGITKLGLKLSVVAVALMVLCILFQIVMRYVFNNAPAWTEEASRFFMLWMVAFVAPKALREGGFVAIQMLEMAIPKKIGAYLGLILQLLAMVVLFGLIAKSYNHVNTGWLFSSSSLKIPLSLIGMNSIGLKLAWTYMSIFVCSILMMVVSIELVWRNLISIFSPNTKLPPIGHTAVEGV